METLVLVGDHDFDIVIDELRTLATVTQVLPPRLAPYDSADEIRDFCLSRGLGDVYKSQAPPRATARPTGNARAERTDGTTRVLLPPVRKTRARPCRRRRRARPARR